MAILQDLLGIELALGPTDANTPDAIEARRKLAMAMLARGQDTSQIKSGAQGLNSVLQSMLGAYGLRKADEEEKLGKKEADALLLKAFGGDSGSSTQPASATSETMTAPASTSNRSETPSLVTPAAGGGSAITGSGDLTDRITMAESGGRNDAKNPRSSALGPGQFISSTWLSTIKRHMPTLAQGKSDAQLLALRTDPNISREMTSAYARDNAEELRSAGLPTDDGSLYLAHFAGSGGAKQVLRADPSTPVTNILSPAAVEANPFLRRMNAGQLRAWANKKVGGGGETSAQGVRTASMPGATTEAAPVARRASADVQTALLLMRNPRTEKIGQLMLQRELAKEGKAPTIVKVPDELGGETAMVLNPQTGKLDPISSLFTDAPSSSTAGDALQPLNGAPAAADDLQPLSPAPQAPSAAPAPAASVQQAAFMLPGDLTTSNIGEIGPSSAPAPSPASAAPRAASQSAPAAASATVDEIPAGALAGPAWQGKIQEGFVQRQAPDGRFLYGADRRPLLELKSAADARAKGSEKRAVSAAEKDAATGERQETANRFGEIVADLRGLPGQFGKTAFERSIGPWSAGGAQTKEEQGGLWGTGVSVNSLGQTIARGYGEAQAAMDGGATPTEVRDTTEQKLLSLATLTKPLVRKAGEGAWTDADQVNLERLVGQATRARTVDEYQRRVDEVVRTFEKAFGVDVPDMAATPRTKNAPETVEEGSERRARAFIEEAIRRSQAQPQPAPAAPMPLPPELPANMHPLLRAMIAR